MSSEGTGIIRPGMTHLLVGNLQEQLHDLGFAVDDPVNFFGPGTSRALRDFQSRKGLPVTGEIDDRTWKELFRTTVLPNDLTAAAGGAPVNALDSTATVNINIGARRLMVFRGSGSLGPFPVAVGKPATPTPVGTFSILNKIVNPGGVYGSRWLGFTTQGHGIHGTNRPQSIGHAVSNGCVRMYNRDVETIFPVVAVGSPVIVVVSSGSAPHPVFNPAPAQPRPGGGDRVHTVRPGESLYAVARLYGTTVEAIMRANNLSSTIIYPGQQLVVP
ncbi:L,D-transpeptidase family protein [Desulforudis sp. 1088]|uniref:L,D-transpeptidase family protein n=1 Tax=unclassified Candidatus Desulforudis TaxID=2635950 RepID=UPI003CE5BD40